MAHPQRGSFAAALPAGETLESVRRKQVEVAARRAGISPAQFRRSQARAAALRAGVSPPPSAARQRRELARALTRRPLRALPPDRQTFSVEVPLPPELADVIAFLQVTRRS